MAESTLRILHLNDLHGSLRPEHLARIRNFQTPESLVFDTGDAIKAGNLAIPLRREEVWSHFAQIPIEAGTIGNRETHLLQSAFEAKIAGVAHPLLCANLKWRHDGSPVLSSSLVVERSGLRIGIFGVSVAMVTERMASRVASAYLWDDPISTARSIAKDMRSEVDVLIALTHIGYSKDRLLADSAPEIDLIFGGHSHTVLEEPVQVGQTWIAQGGSHARFVGVYEYDAQAKQLTGGLQPLKGADAPTEAKG